MTLAELKKAMADVGAPVGFLSEREFEISVGLRSTGGSFPDSAGCLTVSKLLNKFSAEEIAAACKAFSDSLSRTR